MSVRRSQLSTPASDLEMARKAAAIDADEVFLDLEDSVAPTEKPGSRENVVIALSEADWSGKISSFRMNAVDTPWWYDDLITVVGGAGDYLDDVIVPMVEHPSDVATVENLLEQVEVNNGLDVGAIGIELQIETAAGMNNVKEIAGASDRLSALIFGPGDYTASIDAGGLSGGPAEGYPGHYWHYALQRVVHAAKAVGLPAIDGPYADYTNPEGYRESAELAAKCGCDGKWAIHPSQIETANDVFAPSEAEIDHAERIVEAVEEAQAAGKGAVTVDGKMVDEATRKKAVNVLDTADAAGRR